MFACLDDKGDDCIIEIELPSVEKKNIYLKMHEDLIMVRAERKDLALLGHLRFRLKSNPRKAEAIFKQGLLELQVPVKEKRSPRQL